MIRTPHAARFTREEARLVVGPPHVYVQFAQLTVGVGLVLFVIGWYELSDRFYREWWLWTGVAVAFAGGLAIAAMDAVTFDFRSRTYVRRQGPGFAKRITRGGFDGLDALQLRSAPGYAGTGTVTYSLVLYWKGSTEPPLVLITDTRRLSMGAPASAGAGPLRGFGVRIAERLGVMLYDNAHL